MLSICFSCLITLPKHQKQSTKDFKNKSFIDQYKQKEIYFPLHKKDQKKFHLNNKSIALNILYVPQNTKEIRNAYNSKCIFKRENPVILLMITDGGK